jgi:hypothetical protein
MARPRALTPAAVVDAVAVAFLLGCGLAGFWPVFGGAALLRPALTGLAAGAAVAWLAAWRRWNTVTTGLATVVAYFACGAAALPKHAVAGFVPSVTTLRDLAFGAVQVWRQFLTATTPVDVFPGLALVPYIVALVGAVAAFSAAWRARRPALALIPAGSTLLAAIVLGTVEPFHPIVQGVGASAAALLWLAWRRRQGLRGGDALAVVRESRGARVARLRDSALVLAAAAVAAGFAGPALAQDAERDVARSHIVPPLDLRAYASPLTQFRHDIDQLGEETLFTVTGWDKDYRLRLAVLDAYDGMVMNVNSATGADRYDRVGPRLGRAADGGGADSVTVTVGAYQGVWVPGLADLRSVTFTGSREDQLSEGLYYNSHADALVNPVGLTTGDSYTMTADVAEWAAGDTAGLSPDASVRQSAPEHVPDAVSDLGTRFAGDDREASARISNVIANLKLGFFSHGLEGQEPSKAGHSSARIAELLADPDRMVGDDEQYAVAAALMLRQLGFPARVVMGFFADDESTIDGDTWTVTGDDVHAWVEVPFTGLGPGQATAWVPFFPTPDENQEPVEQTPQSRPDPKPQVLQPPPPPNDVEAEDPQNNPAEREADEDETKPSPFPWGMVIRVGLIAGLPLILLLTPPLTVVALKRSRTRRRSRADDPARRVTGGWQEILDSAADLGAVVPPAATRRQAGRLLGARYEAAGRGLAELAERADRGAFGPDAPTAAEAAGFWADAAATRRSLTRSVPWRRRVRGRVALTSLKKAPSPTVDLEAAT